MTLIRDHNDCGFLRRLVRVYREKRRRVPVKEYRYEWGWSRVPQERLKLVHRRMPRRSAFQIAWHQARNAQGVGRAGG